MGADRRKHDSQHVPPERRGELFMKSYHRSEETLPRRSIRSFAEMSAPSSSSMRRSARRFGTASRAVTKTVRKSCRPQEIYRKRMVRAAPPPAGGRLARIAEVSPSCGVGALTIRRAKPCARRQRKSSSSPAHTGNKQVPGARRAGRAERFHLAARSGASSLLICPGGS